MQYSTKQYLDLTHVYSCGLQQETYIGFISKADLWGYDLYPAGLPCNWRPFKWWATYTLARAVRESLL